MAAAARIVLRDWSIGKFDRYTTPSAPTNTATAQSSSITAKLVNPCDKSLSSVNDEAILSSVQTRKERRKQGCLIKLGYGSIDRQWLWKSLGKGCDDENG